MTVMPADAPRSDDGQWWWDGTQWQPVTQDAGGPATAQPSGAANTETASDVVGQLSDDGQWRWDGTEWQPVQDGAAASTPAVSGIAVTFNHATAEAHTTNDGTPAIVFNYSITNSGTAPIDSGRLEVGYYVLGSGASAEAAAYNVGEVLAAIAPGEEHQGHSPVQADPGEWTVWVAISDTTTGQQVAASENMTAVVAGSVALAPTFDDTQTYALTVTITSVEHVQGALFRVHYDLQSDRDVPAGLNVSGKVDGAQSKSAQLYDLTTGLTAGQARAHYLTLEADIPDHITTSITVDPGGPSEQSDSVEVDITADGTTTISR
jgi:hypothetical protein